MRIYKYMVLSLFAILCASSCSVTRQRAYSPSLVQLNLQMSDLKYLGETEISVDYRTYLGVIRVIDAVNGEKYTGKEIHRTAINNGCIASQSLSKPLNRASFKVFQDFPDADYAVVVKQERNIKRLFLGNDVSAKATVKVYKLK